MVCQRQGSEELAPELSAKRKRACPASILSARLLFAAVSVQGVAGLHSFRDVEARWWLHLYVMFVRVTCVRNMLLLSPPLRELLEKGLAPSVREVLRMFAEKITDSTRMAASWASDDLEESQDHQVAEYPTEPPPPFISNRPLHNHCHLQHLHYHH